MKYTLIAILVTLAVVAAKPTEETYTSRFDNIDLEKILNTKRLFENYFKCLMDQGKCPPDAKELKKLLPDALKTNCAKCTPKQQEGTDRVLRFMIEHKPKEWAELKAKYDPKDEFVNKYRDAARARGIEI